MREVPVRMPKFSMAQEEGTLLVWHKAEGDSIAAGELLCEVATDKVDMEVESPVTGVIRRLITPEREAVPVGEPIALVDTESDDLLEGLLDAPPEQPGAQAAPEDAPAPQAPFDPYGEESGATPPSRAARRPAMPGARRRAAELGVALTDLPGSGKGGVVTLADVETAARGARRGAQPEVPRTRPAPQPAPVPAASGDPVTLDPGYADALAQRRQTIRAAVARRMSESAAVPQFTVYADLDLDRLAAQREGVGWTAWLTRALAMTARDHASVNAVWNGGGAEHQAHVGVALAVDTPVGLLAPVLRDPDLLEPGALDELVRHTVDRARNGTLTVADLEGATITLSNLGGFDVFAFQALLTPPQVAALSVGSIGLQPVVHHGGLSARMRCRVGLTVDHRAADGADAARFLAQLRALVADPHRLREQAR